MSKSSKYDELLIEESKRGRQNSYINLCYIYIYSVFSLVFKLIPVRNEAIKISAETFLVVWRNIKNISSLDDYKNRIKEVAKLRCIDYLSKITIETLTDEDIQTLGSQFRNPISEIEKDILKLPTNERVIVVLSDQLGLTVSEISKLFNKVPKKEIPEMLNKTRQKLIRTRPSEFFFKYSEEQWNELNQLIKKVAKFSILEFTHEEENIVKEYLDYSKELLQDLFMSILPNQEIKDILRNFILNENASAAVKEVQVIAETDVIKTENLVKKHKHISKTKISIFKKISFAIPFILVLFYFLATSIKLPTTWSINDEFVLSIVNGKNATSKELNIGDVITTGENKKTKIINSEEAEIEILQNSNLKLNDITAYENIFELKNGSIKFNTKMSYVEYSVEEGIKYKIMTSLATIETFNSNFYFAYFNKSGFSFEVKFGWVSLKPINSNSLIYCAGGYIINYDPATVILIPYRKKSSIDFISAVQKFAKFPEDEEAFNFIIRNAKEYDSLTLWHLLNNSDPTRQKLIIDKLDLLLLLDLKSETKNGASFSPEAKQNLLKFIRSMVVMRE